MQALAVASSSPSSLPLVGAAVAVAVATVAALLGLRRFFAPRSGVIDRLERTVGPTYHSERPADRDQGTTSAFLRPLAWIAKPSKAEALGHLRQKLVHAGLRGPRALEMFLAAKLALAITLTVAFLLANGELGHYLKFPTNYFVAFWICIVAFFIPQIYVRRRAARRQVFVSNALPDTMDLLVTCVEAGLGLDAALFRVAQEISVASPILGSEMNLTFLEMQAGVARADAFRRLAERTGVEDLRSLSATLIQTEVFGTSVARALRVHGDGMRVRRMQQAEEKTAMVGVKMTFPLVLFILPALIAVIIGPAVVSILNNVINKVSP
jgi:tight adherence protein C